MGKSDDVVICYVYYLEAMLATIADPRSKVLTSMVLDIVREKPVLVVVPILDVSKIGRDLGPVEWRQSMVKNISNPEEIILDHRMEL